MDVHERIFVAMCFITVKMWKQDKLPKIEDGLNEL
jgi:hypothetical protein